MPTDSLVDFFEALCRHRLLAPDQLDEVTRTLRPKFPDARALARELVKRDWLTPYQANQLFLGRGQNLVLGPYVLLERLGMGGLGQVFKAKDDRGQLWAVKVVDTSSRPESAGYLRREAELARRVAHANLLQVIDYGEQPPYAYLVMELASGISLAQELAGARQLPIRDAVDIAVGVLEALEAIHARGFVHRDVKPSNILVSRPADGAATSPGRRRLIVKLLDLALMRAIEPSRSAEDEESGGIVGTPAYVAPEQLGAPGRMDGRADLYGLGCTLFQALCGRLPFAGTDMQQLFSQHLHAPRPDPREFRPGVSEALARVVVRLMAVNPDDRFPSAREAIAALRDVSPETLTGDIRAPAPEPPTADEGLLAAPAAPALGAPRAGRSLLQNLRQAVSGVWSALTGRRRGAGRRPGLPPPPTAEAPAAEYAPLAPGKPISTASQAPAEAAPTSPPPLTAPGARLEQFQLLQQVDEDYAWTLYHALDTALDAEVMLEVLKPQHRGEPEIVERFRRRARAGAVVDHPNVHKVFALHHGDEACFCVLEPLRGRTLAERLAAERPLPLPEALAVAEQILLGLHAVHARGLVHRDLKPANVFLKDLPAAPPPDGTADPPAWSRPWALKLTGFELVRETAADVVITHHGTTMGTPAFMAPEQALGQPADARADLYALGCILFEMVCGRPPYQGSTFAILAQLTEGEVPDPAAFRPDLPVALRDFIRRLLARRPDDRYPGAAEALHALEQARAALRRPAPAEAPAEDTAVTAAARPARRLHHLLRLDDRAFSAEMVVTHYPAPVALAYRRFYREAEPRARLERLFFAVEAGLRYLVTLGLADLLQCLTGDSQDNLALPRHGAFDFLRRHQPMQLGLWLTALRETARELAGQPGRLIPELPEVCAPGGRLEREVLQRLVESRNQVTHRQGSVPVTADECRELGRDARPVLEEFLEAVRFVCAYPLGFVQAGLVLDQQAEGKHGYYLHSCMGADVESTAEAYHVETPTALREGTPFVAAGDGTRLLYLWPFLCQQASPLSGRHTLYAFEDIPDRGRGYLTQTRSAALDTREEWRQALRREPAAGHGWMLGTLRELRALSAVPADLEVHLKLMPWRGGALTGVKLGGVQLLAPVGRGGFGTIYAAATPAGQKVAVKVLESASVSPRQQQRFRAEFARLKSVGEGLAGLAEPPGIIRCFESNVLMLDGRVYPWYSMEFALGGDLGGRIEERRGRQVGRAAWADPEGRRQVVHEFRQVAAAVAYLHDRHIIHRDLKPSNVLILEDGRLCLSDFGLAKHLGSADPGAARGPMTSSGAVLGTRCYMAPEQEKGQGVAEPADVYSLGVLLAELAVGERPPAGGASRGSALQSWRRLKQLPDGLRRFVLRLTDVDPGRRPANARAVQQEFEAVLAKDG
jgi:serine/threonine protein kinase